MFDLARSPFLVLLVPVLVSLFSRDLLVIASVAAASFAGAVAGMGVPAGQEQWLVIGLMSLAGTLFAVFGTHTRRTLRSAERLKDQLADVRLATSSLRNAIEYERERERERERLPQASEEEHS
jgi:hypothetical protein